MPHPTPFFACWLPQLAPLGRRCQSALRPLRQATLSQIEQCFANALPGALLAQNEAKDHSRERIFTLARTFWGWIWQVLQAHTSCREVVRQVQALFALHEAGEVDQATGAYCQARRKLPHTALLGLFQASASSAQKAAGKLLGKQALLGGRSIQVIDCSGARLCDTAENRAAFPPSKSLAAGAGFPYMRIAALFCLSSGALLAQATGSLLKSELRLCLELLPKLHRADILLADRAYGKYIVAALLQAAGIDLIAAVAARSRKVDFRKAKKRFASNDALFHWKKGVHISPLLEPSHWRSLPEQIAVRLLRVHLERPGFRAEHFTLVTTLLDPVAYPAHEIIAAYARRWRMEMSLNDLKTTLGMEQLRCHKPQMLQKELLVFLTAHNLVRWLMAEAASQEQAPLERISFKGTLDALRQWSQAMAQRRRRPQLWRALLKTIAADALPLRPGRHEPRAVKKRSKYPHLNQPRHQYRERWGRTKRRRIANANKRAPLN